MGGKPVPLVGWVFIDRLPVRPSAAKSVKKASREANRPMPIPRTPPPNIKLAAKTKATAPSATAAPAASARTKPTTAVNDLTPFLEFVEKYKIGSKVKGVVETYSAHGVYVRIGNVLGYLPLRLMSNPPPRSAREFVKIGQQVSLVVSSFTASRRSIDVGIVGPMTEVKRSAATVASAPAAPTKRAKKQKKRPAAVQTRKAPAKKK